MRDATNQSDDLLIRDSTVKMDQDAVERQEPEEMSFNDIDLVEEDSSQDGGEEQDTVGELSQSVRSTLFDEHLLPTKTSQRAS